jgi:hypothetical protein
MDDLPTRIFVVGDLRKLLKNFTDIKSDLTSAEPNKKKANWLVSEFQQPLKQFLDSMKVETT